MTLENGSDKIKAGSPRRRGIKKRKRLLQGYLPCPDKNQIICTLPGRLLRAAAYRDASGADLPAIRFAAQKQGGSRGRRLYILWKIRYNIIIWVLLEM